jgi:hypothetical protein
MGLGCHPKASSLAFCFDLANMKGGTGFGLHYNWPEPITLKAGRHQLLITSPVLAGAEIPPRLGYRAYLLLFRFPGTPAD